MIRKHYVSWESIDLYVDKIENEIKVDQRVFKSSKDDVFITYDKKEFTSFIDKIESQSIETNAIEYMFRDANEKLSSDAQQLLKDIYAKVG